MPVAADAGTGLSGAGVAVLLPSVQEHPAWSASTGASVVLHCPICGFTLLRGFFPTILLKTWACRHRWFPYSFLRFSALTYVALSASLTPLMHVADLFLRLLLCC